MEILEISKKFPKEERYSLTDQIRRSSRSVTSCIGESWARRRYIKSFVNKLVDALGEENETEVWLDYSFDCKYIDKETQIKLLRCSAHHSPLTSQCSTLYAQISLLILALMMAISVTE